MLWQQLLLKQLFKKPAQLISCVPKAQPCEKEQTLPSCSLSNTESSLKTIQMANIYLVHINTARKVLCSIHKTSMLEVQTLASKL